MCMDTLAKSMDHEHRFQDTASKHPLSVQFERFAGTIAYAKIKLMIMAGIHAHWL
uniref:Uncharacterized protein n=1 Tax=Physcomitrium patens TaxID=3218 RepID=A0A2K1KZR2_PHYPA|nr:hypothetical protein PHYPA_002050 [Physcomitrium patens]